MDTALKQRLVGASVLIALAVIVLPMLLGGRPDGDVQETQKIELPSHPAELDFETRRYPVGEIPPSRSPKNEPSPAKALPTPSPASGVVTHSEQDETPGDTPDETAQAESPDEPQVTPGQDPEEIAVNPAPEEAPSKVVIAPLAAPAEKTEEAGRYVVQVASFGALDNANRLAGTLRGYGYPVLLDSVKSDVGTLHRVRVGPYATEAEANGTIGRLQAQVKNIKPRVMDLQPEKTAQVAQPSDPLGRWVVQVGSFSNDENADNLVARLRLESLSAYKEEIRKSGSVVFRVRVGPFLEREEAIKADKKIVERLSIEGVVMSAD
jgi:DedD protein